MISALTNSFSFFRATNCNTSSARPGSTEVSYGSISRCRRLRMELAVRKATPYNQLESDLGLRIRWAFDASNRNVDWNASSASCRLCNTRQQMFQTRSSYLCTIRANACASRSLTNFVSKMQASDRFGTVFLVLFMTAFQYSAGKRSFHSKKTDNSRENV